MPKYKLPLQDSLVVAHENPDGDALSSIKAVLTYLRKNGKTAVAKVSGIIPEHLGWILSSEDLPSKIPEMEQTIVLDCGPTADRVGFEVNEPIINIDHHITRKDEHNPKKKIYVLDRCSTAAALILDFDIVDSILLVGLQTDTMFMKHWGELVKCFNKIEVSDEEAETILSSIRPIRYTQALMGLKNAKFHRCRNGLLIAETDEKDIVVVNEIMDTLFRYNESVCLVYSDNKVKLRTSNKALIDEEKLSDIAKLFSGGGHPHASMCSIEGKRTTFFGLLKQLEITENEVLLGEGEENV